MLGSDVLSVEFFEDQQPSAYDRYVPWVANPLGYQAGPSPLLDKVKQFAFYFVATHVTACNQIFSRRSMIGNFCVQKWIMLTRNRPRL